MINYTLPDFTVGLGLNLFFIRLLEQRPALFQDGVRIDLSLIHISEPTRPY